VPTPPLALFLLLFLARNAVSWRIDKLRRGAYREDSALPTETRISQEGTEEARERAKAIERRLAVASYTEAKTLLQASQQELTFVSLDIVGSTVLKQGEDPYVVEQCFADYRKLVERALRRHGACKQVWTPDGQMAAFRNPQAGVECAKEVLLQLPEFNRERSRLKRPFRIRAGANIGSLSTDERTPMEQISDFSIDIAGHMQKYADPDTLWISEELYGRLEDPDGFGATGKEVDGSRVFAWKKDEQD
jgi:class 3 adenylate cyclase